MVSHGGKKSLILSKKVVIKLSCFMSSPIVTGLYDIIEYVGKHSTLPLCSHDIQLSFVLSPDGNNENVDLKSFTWTPAIDKGR